jgi:hypothetical protein
MTHQAQKLLHSNYDLFITHSLPQPTLYAHPEQPRSPPPDGLPLRLPHPYSAPECLGRLASLARCGTGERPLHLHNLVRHGPKPEVIIPIVHQYNHYYTFLFLYVHSLYYMYKDSHIQYVLITVPS